MKKSTLIFAAFVLMGSQNINASSMSPLTADQVTALWATTQQKCKQNIEKTRALLAPSDSTRRAAGDALRGVFGKDTKEGKKAEAMKKLNAYEMQQTNDTINITTKMTALVANKADATAFQGMESAIRDHGMKCDSTTADLAKEAP